MFVRNIWKGLNFHCRLVRQKNGFILLYLFLLWTLMVTYPSCGGFSLTNSRKYNRNSPVCCQICSWQFLLFSLTHSFCFLCRPPRLAWIRTPRLLTCPPHSHCSGHLPVLMRKRLTAAVSMATRDALRSTSWSTETMRTDGDPGWNGLLWIWTLMWMWHLWIWPESTERPTD